MNHWTTEDQRYMSMALELAKRGEGHTRPNPMVGAVLVQNGQIVGRGWHRKFGGHHAEVEAFNDALQGRSGQMEKLEGATLYVTLEPCSHHGKTPPCTEAIMANGIGRVVVALEDPNPLVVGKGIQQLRSQGIQVDVGLMAEEAREVNEIFLHYIQHGTPFVTLKTAMTLDGKICTGTGESKWITGPESRAHVHELRNRYAAILVGVGTVVADDPSLTTREISGRHPLRVVLDSHLRSPLESKVFQCQNEAENPIKTLLIATSKAPAPKLEILMAKGVEVHLCQRGKIEVEEVLKVLGQKGIDGLLVEGGSEVNASFLEAGAVQKMVAFIAPKLIGGGGKSPVGGVGKEKLSEAWELENIKIKPFGRDLMIEGTIKRGDQNVYRAD